MRPNISPQEAAYLLQLVLLYLGVQQTSSAPPPPNKPAAQTGSDNTHQAPPKPAAQTSDNNKQNYAYYDQNQNQQMSEQNSDYGVYDDAKEQLFCYSCSYHVRKGNVAGHENCRDPFIKTDIPEVPCSGTCAKMYHKISDTEYTITRGCLPNCKDVADDKGYTQCCTGSLCNGGAATTGVSCLLLTSSLAASTWYGLR